MPALVDSHCHLDLEVFAADRQAVLDRAAGAGVGRIVIPALNYASALRVVELADALANVFAAVGVHPTETQDSALTPASKWGDLAHRRKVVAFGEIGLDYFWVTDRKGRARQRGLLQKQLALAQQFHLPVILHLREEGDAIGGSCSRDMLDILRDWTRALQTAGDALASRPGVLHSFSGSLEVALEAMDLGFFIGVTGPVTFPKADARREVVRNLPLDRILIETDAPFLAPVPYRGRRNEPAFVTHIADKIAGNGGRYARLALD
ncbi:MAG: TatD family hydrolase, partial [Anaerolineales bacterium]